MSEVKVNKITPTANCGTVTLGDSGDTFSLPAGVTLSNAGSITNSGTITNTGTISGGTITGTIDNQVNWDTTAKTTGFTAVAGNGYFVNTTSGAITVTLPATPTAGDLVGIKDYANTADTNNITIDRNGSNIQGVANNYTISTQGLSITLIYVDGTQGWVSTGAAKASDISEQQLFVTATGGTITTSGDYKIHTFTGPGTFCVSCAGNAAGSNSVNYMVVGGGGSGGYSFWLGTQGGGGGGGGYRTNYPSPDIAGAPVTVTAYPITVGAGGSGGTSTRTDGSNSIFSTITSAGGGAGALYTGTGNSGGSGGGGGSNGGSGGAGNTPPVSPPQGNPGGGSGSNSAGGGGGSGGSGGSAPGSTTGGTGGVGTPNSIGGSSIVFGGGGGGAGSSTGGPAPACGAGAGASGLNNGQNACASYGAGGGGGGQGFPQPSDSGNRAGGNGGSGKVVIRYKYQ